MEQLDLFQLKTPSMPTLDVSRCYTKPINYETAARMVEKYHYAHRVPSIVVAVGMYVDDILAGCCTYGSIPANNAKAICGKEYQLNVLELTRLFIFDWCGRNSESWLIGQSFKWLQKQWPRYFTLISYSDTAHSHQGYIYQATNWLYTGTSVSAVYQDDNGNTVHRRTAADPRKGLNDAVFRIQNTKMIRAIEKPKHRYVYFLGNRRQRRELRKALKWPVLPYPKRQLCLSSPYTYDI